MEYNLARKINGLLIHAIKWIDLKNVRLSDRSKAHTMWSHLYETLKEAQVIYVRRSGSGAPLVGSGAGARMEYKGAQESFLWMDVSFISTVVVIMGVRVSKVTVDAEISAYYTSIKLIFKKQKNNEDKVYTRTLDNVT